MQGVEVNDAPAAGIPDQLERFVQRIDFTAHHWCLNRHGHSKVPNDVAETAVVLYHAVPLRIVGNHESVLGANFPAELQRRPHGVEGHLSLYVEAQDIHYFHTGVCNR